MTALQAEYFQIIKKSLPKGIVLDIQEAWAFSGETPERQMAFRVVGSWFHSVDPETMQAVKGLIPYFPGTFSLDNIFTWILKNCKA